jgi:outer membrane murein-binding lipoprotein Lpp
MYTNHRHYILLIFAIAAFALSGCVYIFLRQKIQGMAVEAALQSAEIDRLDEKKQHERDVASAYAKFAMDRELINSSVVSQENIVKLIEEIEAIGTLAGIDLELSAIRNGEFTTNRGLSLGHFEAHASGKGSWAQVMHTLALVENMKYSISINNLRLFEASDVVAGKETGRRVWKLEFDMKILTTK